MLLRSNTAVRLSVHEGVCRSTRELQRYHRVGRRMPSKTMTATAPHHGCNGKEKAMKFSRLEFRVALALTFMMGLLLTAAPRLTMADDGKGNVGQANPVENAQPGDVSQPSSSSADIQERGLPLGSASVPGSAVLQPSPVPFKCSANTLTCRCYGVSDCNWMRRVMGQYCMPPDGCAQNCECRITK